jgi:hypothetical protein
MEEVFEWVKMFFNRKRPHAFNEKRSQVDLKNGIYKKVASAQRLRGGYFHNDLLR